MFFPPAGSEQAAASEETEDEAVADMAEGDEAIPQLPDVPTTEPKEAGQPEAKKLKLDEDGKD